MDSTEPEDIKQESPAPRDEIAYHIPAGVDFNTGATTRKWLNEHVTPSLLQGMRLLAKEKPEDPLRVLGEFLISKSKS
jgi:COMPASS component SDC1